MCVCGLLVTWRANGIVLYMYEGQVLMDMCIIIDFLWTNVTCLCAKGVNALRVSRLLQKANEGISTPSLQIHYPAMLNITWQANIEVASCLGKYEIFIKILIPIRITYLLLYYADNHCCSCVQSPARVWNQSTKPPIHVPKILEGPTLTPISK